MYPVNQVILGGESMFNNIEDIDMQISKMEAYRQKLKQLKDSQQVQQSPKSILWDKIDEELFPMSNEQKNRLMQDESYMEIYNEFKKGKLYKKPTKTIWYCPSCGYVGEGKEAWDECPLCKAKQGVCNLSLPDGYII